jgi:hypothetical protein
MRQLHVFCGLVLRLFGLGFKLLAEFPAKMVFEGESRVVRGRFSPPRWFWRGT